MTYRHPRPDSELDGGVLRAEIHFDGSLFPKVTFYHITQRKLRMLM